MDVSIIIVNWNTKDILRDCLLSIYQQQQYIEYEVIVIDNASCDGSVRLLREEFPQVVLIENTVNKGFATANNQGMALAKGRYCLLLNSDTLVLDNAIAKAIGFSDQHGEAAVVGCRVLNPDKTLQPTCFMFPSLLNMVLSSTYLYKLFSRNRFFGRERLTWWQRDDVRLVDVVTGCFMLVRRQAIDQIGMMDENFFMYGEETDWCYRFSQAGWQVLFFPDAQIIHLGGQSTAKSRVEMLVQLKLSILKFIRKHHGWLTFRMACFFTALFLSIRVPVWLGIALLDRNRRKPSMARVAAYLMGVKQILTLT